LLKQITRIGTGSIKILVPSLIGAMLFFNSEIIASFSKNHLTRRTKLIHRIPPVMGIRIAWDYTSLTKISPSDKGIKYAGYPRLIQLNDQSLLCVFEADGYIVGTKSKDFGATWSNQIKIADPVDGVNMSVPDILELADHSLLVSYNPRPVKPDPSKPFAIKTKKSFDGGLTWVDERTLYEADYKFKNGCWEPSAIQLPDGEIQLFFANEGVYRATDEQNISMLKSSDGGLNWTKTPRIVSFRTGKRDGMPCPLLLQNKQTIVFSIEDNGYTTFKPYIIRNTVYNSWPVLVNGSSSNRNYALQDKLDDSIYAGAPYLRQLRTGETILSYQGTEGRSNDPGRAEMRVVIGNDEALYFNRKTSPFKIALNKSGLWNSLSVLNDNTVVALTSTNNYSNSNNMEIWMIKGHVIPEICARKQSSNIQTNQEVQFLRQSFPVFIGQSSNKQLLANFTYDNNDLYLQAIIKDRKVIMNKLAIGNNEEVTLYVDAENRSYNRPDEGVFKLRLSADNKLLVYEGYKSVWRLIGIKYNIKHMVKMTDQGYTIKIAIPWKLLRDEPLRGTRIGYNVSLTYNTGALRRYTENISSNQADQPYTWSTLYLK